MPTKTHESPAVVADQCEMLAQQQMDDGDKELVELFMDPAHAIRRALNALARLNNRVHTGYDFNGDPDRITLEVGEVLKDYTPRKP